MFLYINQRLFQSVLTNQKHYWELKGNSSLNMYLHIQFYLKCLELFWSVWKQPLEVFCGSECSWGVFGIHRRVPVLGSLFDKVAGLRPAALLRGGPGACFLWFLQNFWAPFLSSLQSTSGQLLLSKNLHLWYLANL